MNSKERLLRCIHHEDIDRVPVSTYELVGWNDEAWENSEPGYKKLMDTVRKYTDCIYMLNPGLRQIPNPAAEVDEWHDQKSHYVKRTFHTSKGSLTSLHREDEGVHTVWTIKHLLEDIEDIDTYLSIPYEQPEVDMSHFYQERDKLGDKGLMMISVDDPVCLAAELFEMGTFLVHAITEPEKVKYFLDAIHERQMHDLKKLLKNDVKDVIFRVCGPEYCTPPYLSPEYYYNYVTCYLIDICKEIKAAGGIPRIHCHGKIGEVIDQFAVTEAEAIDPVEPLPDGDIELSDVKKLYGKKFCLFGNIELKELECAEKGRIDQLVKKAMDDAKEGSGYVIMPTAAPITAQISPKMEENYMCYIESALKYGRY